MFDLPEVPFPFRGRFTAGLLQRPHFGITPFGCQQGAVGAALDDAACVEHQDFMGIDDRGQAVRDDCLLYTSRCV